MSRLFRMILGGAFSGVGLSVIISTQIHWMITNDQLTNMQALKHYWPFWLPAMVLMCLGFSLFRGNDD